MSQYFQWLFLVLFACIVDANFQQFSQTEIYQKEITCNDTVFKDLDKCWNNLMPIKSNGIATSTLELQRACRAFNAGMECFETWSTTCLLRKQHELGSVITASLKTFKFLCTDPKYGQKYFQHWNSNCYKRISPFWMDCDRTFHTFKLLKNTHSSHSLCCIQSAYNRCVTKFAKGLCSNEATKFLQSFLESLTPIISPVHAHQSECTHLEPKKYHRMNTSWSSAEYYLTYLLIVCVLLRSVTIQAITAVFPIY